MLCVSFVSSVERTFVLLNIGNILNTDKWKSYDMKNVLFKSLVPYGLMFITSFICNLHVPHGEMMCSCM